VTRVPWSLYDSRGNCLDVGTVEAGSDSEALRTVLARPRSDLKPAQWYRVKAGAAVASAAGDEFANVGGQAGVGLDRAAGSAADAMRAAETRRQAEGQLREFLKGKAKSRAAEKLLDGIDAKIPKTGRDVFLKHFAGEVMDSLRGYPMMGGGGGLAGGSAPTAVGHVLRLNTVQITQRRVPALSVYRIEAYGNCANCGIRVGVSALLSGHDPDPSSAPDRIRDGLVGRLRSMMSQLPCPALHP
jgi:hypothetical protein